MRRVRVAACSVVAGPPLSWWESRFWRSGGVGARWPDSSAWVRLLAGPALVLCASAAIQMGSALSVSVFDAVGATATGGLRFLVAAVLLLAVSRPRLRGRSRGSWAAVISFGVVMTAMTMLFYLAADRLPLGTAVAIGFLGPLVVAAAGSRRLREGLWVLLAAVGVVLLVGPSLGGSPTGLLFAGLAACGLAGYVLLSQTVGGRTPGLEGLALSVGVAALLTLPLSLPAAAGLSAAELLKILLSAGLGIALAYALEMHAIRRTSAKTVSVLLSLDPAFAALAGLVLLGQHLTPALAVGLACVVIAGVGVSGGTSQAADGPAN